MVASMAARDPTLVEVIVRLRPSLRNSLADAARSSSVECPSPTSSSANRIPPRGTRQGPRRARRSRGCARCSVISSTTLAGGPSCAGEEKQQLIDTVHRVEQRGGTDIQEQGAPIRRGARRPEQLLRRHTQSRSRILPIILCRLEHRFPPSPSPRSPRAARVPRSPSPSRHRGSRSVGTRSRGIRRRGCA